MLSLPFSRLVGSSGFMAESLLGRAMRSMGIKPFLARLLQFVPWRAPCSLLFLRVEAQWICGITDKLVRPSVPVLSRKGGIRTELGRETAMNSDPFAPDLLGRLPAPPRKVALLRTSRIGDFLCAVPAMRALRKRLPDAEIHMLTLPLLVDLARRLPVLDRVWSFPGFP